MNKGCSNNHDFVPPTQYKLSRTNKLLLLHTVSDTRTRVDQGTPTCGGGDGGGGWCRGRRKGKIYGKDRGVNKTDSPTFSSCFKLI
jgi:hypothetical protein